MVKEAPQKTFFDILKTRGEKLLQYPPPVAIDLSPSPAVREGVSLTLEIIENYNIMMVSASREKLHFTTLSLRYANRRQRRRKRRRAASYQAEAAQVPTQAS